MVIRRGRGGRILKIHERMTTSPIPYDLFIEPDVAENSGSSVRRFNF